MLPHCLHVGFGITDFMHIEHSVILFLGLLRDDTVYEDTDVQEALRRLPEDQYNERVFRIKRALDLSMKQQILPKEMWTKFEEVHPTIYFEESCYFICVNLPSSGFYKWIFPMISINQANDLHTYMHN